MNKKDLTHTLLFARVILFMLGASMSSFLKAQDTQSSVFSRYGYGTLSDLAPTTLKGMGKAGLATSSGKYINLLNPASYAASDSLSFLMDVSLNTEWGNYADGTNSKNAFVGGLDYLAVQFPLWKNRLIFSTGFIPFSTTGYGLQKQVEHTDTEEPYIITQNFTGTGSIQSLYAGLGVRILENLFLGINTRYLFGKTIHSTTNVPNTSLISTTKDIHTLRLRDFLLDFGIQYRLRMNEQNSLSFGATLSPSLSLHPKVTIVHEQNFGSLNYPQITEEEKRIDTRFPLKAGFGVSWDKGDKLLVAADVQLSKWGSVPNIFENDQISLKDSYQVGLGIQYHPDKYSRKYADRIYYRGGVNYKTGYTNGNLIGQLNNISTSFGLGLPFDVNDERTSYVNFSLEYVKAVSSNSSGLSENHLRLSVGVSFNETWFRKLKIY